MSRRREWCVLVGALAASLLFGLRLPARWEVGRSSGVAYLSIWRWLQDEQPALCWDVAAVYLGGVLALALGLWAILSLLRR